MAKDPPIRPLKVEGNAAFCPCGERVEIPRFSDVSDIPKVAPDVRERISTFRRESGPPEVATIKCSECAQVLDLSEPEEPPGET